MSLFKHTFIIGFILSIIMFDSGNAQLSLVPANHDVYDWLHYQRVNGHIREYQHEDLPITRGEVVKYLKDIEKDRNNLSDSDRATLDAYLKEMDPYFLKRSFEKGLFTSSDKIVDRAKYYLTSGDEPHLFAYYDSTRAVNGALDYMIGQAHVFADEDGEKLRSTYYAKGIRTYASVQNTIGLHLEVDNISTSGDIELLRRDTKWGVSGAVLRQRQSSSYSYEAFATLKKDLLSFDVGRGSLRIGPGTSSPLFLRETAPNFNWIRFKVSGKRFKYTAIHGALYASPFNDVVRVGQDTVRTRVAPERWIALHRFSIRPFDRLQISFTEMLTYSNRESDLSYLNPVAPIFFSELENADRDNAFMGLDIVAQPVDRIELYASLLIDDLVSIKQIFKDEATKDDDVAVNFGASVTLPFASQFSVGYTRIEPFVYTHWQRLNTFEQRDRSLGHYLGPNADELEFKVKKWFPFRAWVQIAFRNIRKGFNPIDQDGTEINNTGGNLLNGSDNLGFSMFQDSDLNRWTEFELSFEVEPLRGLNLSANILNRNVLDGVRENDYLVGDFRVEIGL